MDVTPLIRRNAKIIQSYKDGVFIISGDRHDYPVSVTINRALRWDVSCDDARKLTLDDLAAAFLPDEHIEVVLLGTGKNFVMLPLSFRRAFRERFGVTLDVMDTGAASRTFNVLIAEGRDVVALMLPA